MAGFLSNRTAELLRNLPTFSAGSGIDLLRIGNHHVIKARPGSFGPSELGSGGIALTRGTAGKRGGGTLPPTDIPPVYTPVPPPSSDDDTIKGAGYDYGWGPGVILE